MEREEDDTSITDQFIENFPMEMKLLGNIDTMRGITNP
jgi:hypothetical protein